MIYMVYHVVGVLCFMRSFLFFFCKQKTAYEMRISDWSSDVCSSDLDFSGFDVFSEKAAVADADRVQLLDPELLYPDPENVRSAIDEATIDEMAETIKERGQLQPITVAPK